MGSNQSETVTTTRRQLLSVPLAGVGGGFSGQFDSTRNVGESGESTPTSLDRRVPDLLDRYDVPGASIALIEDGEVTWSGAYGTADLAEERPVNENTPFRVQSITKSVTAWGVLKLVEQTGVKRRDG